MAQHAGEELAARLEGCPERVTPEDVAVATGRSVATVRGWIAEPDFPIVVLRDGVGPKKVREYRARDAVAVWLRTHGDQIGPHLAAEPDTLLQYDLDEEVYGPQIAARLGISYDTWRSYATLYATSDNPRPAANKTTSARWGDVVDWHRRRGIDPGSGRPAGRGRPPGRPGTRVAEVAGILDGLGRQGEPQTLDSLALLLGVSQLSVRRLLHQVLEQDAELVERLESAGVLPTWRRRRDQSARRAVAQ
jgi:hypothetical protein